MLSGNLQEFAELGGIGRYLMWAYASGLLCGPTAGILRPVARSGLPLRLSCGLVLGEAFALQPLIPGVEGSETSAGRAAVVMGAMSFVVGVIFGPLMVAGLKRSWPEQLVRSEASKADRKWKAQQYGPGDGVSQAVT